MLSIVTADLQHYRSHERQPCKIQALQGHKQMSTKCNTNDPQAAVKLTLQACVIKVACWRLSRSSWLAANLECCAAVVPIVAPPVLDIGGLVSCQTRRGLSVDL